MLQGASGWVERRIREFLGVVAWLSATAASGDFRVDVWQTEEGLPHNTVTALTQTQDGYLWLGTQGGLVRFDGVRFTVLDTHNTPEFPSDRIVQLAEAPDGTLWIGTELGGVVSVREGRLSVYRSAGRGTAHNYARVLATTPQGGLWMVSCEWELLRFTEGRFEREEAGGLLAGEPCYGVSVEGDRVWAGTGTSLLCQGPEGWMRQWGPESESDFRVEAMAPAREGGCWVAAHRRLRRFGPNGCEADRGAYAWTNRPVYALHEDRDDGLWVATLGAGVHRYAPEGVLSFTMNEGLPNDLVRCVIEDREGNVWLGTEGGGLCRLKPSPFRVVGLREGLPSEQVLSVSESGDGSLWVGTNGDGLTRMKDGAVERFGPLQGLDNGHVWSVLTDARGRVWAGTWDGLFARDEQGRFQRRSDNLTVNGPVLGLFADTAQALWVGQQGLGGVARLDDEAPVSPPLPGLPDLKDVRVMARTTDGARWFGTSGHGLVRWHQGNVTQFDRSGPLGSDTVWSLHADATGALWIGTYRGGLACWKEGQIRRLTPEHGLPDSTLCQILEDDQGHLWLGTYGGIWRAERDTLWRALNQQPAEVAWFGLTKADGLPGIQCSGGFQPSGCRSRDGRLWFPTSKGLVAVDPEKVHRNEVPPPVRIEALRTDGHLVAGNIWAGTPDRIELSPGTRQLEFEYTAPSLTAPGKVRFRHRLEGQASTWTPPTAARSATYTLAGPGRYRFEVMAANNDGVWNTDGASLEIEALPQFWETRWFLSSSGLAVLVTVAGVARHRVRRAWSRRLQQAEREQALERERARIARDLHDELGAGLTQIALLGELAGDDHTEPQEQRLHLETLKARSRQLTRSLDEIVWAVNPRCDSLTSLVSYLTQFAREFLVTGSPRLRLDIPVELPNCTLPVGVRHHLFLAVKEAFNNAAKHAAAAEIILRLRLADGRLRITVADDGRGFDPLTLRDDRSGLTNLRQRLADLGGSATVRSAPGAGTQVEFCVPLSGPDAS